MCMKEGKKKVNEDEVHDQVIEDLFTKFLAWLSRATAR